MKTKFWKIYSLVTGLAVIACIAVFIVLWTFLSSYEKAQPEHTAEAVVTMFQNLDVDQIMSHYSNHTKFSDDEQTKKEAIRKHIQGSEYTYSKKMSQYTTASPAYSIKADGKEIAVLRLAQSDKRASYNSVIWTIADIDLGFSTEGHFEIIAPSDYTVTVNGSTLTTDSIVESGINSSDLENVIKYTQVPLLVKYRVENSFINPDIKCVGSVSSKELIPEINKNVYKYDYETDDTVIAQNSDNIKKFITNYTKYMYTEADFSSISGSVISNSKAYEFLRYITYTNIWFADHSSLTIGDIHLSNVKQYSPLCYSVEADYTYDVVMAGNNYNYPTKITLYYVKTGNSWKIADLQTH